MISHFKTSATWSLQHLLERKLSGKLRIEYVAGSQTQKKKKVWGVACGLSINHKLDPMDVARCPI